jgi:mannose-6-phosphate isomerase-like protein (cupin superfamily)
VKIFDFGSRKGFDIRGFDSRGANAVPLTLPDGDAHVVCIRLDAGGVLGRHPAAVDQVFAVVEGEGWVRGPDGEQVPVSPGTAVHWSAGEEHESGTETGMIAIVVEAERLIPHLP